jgi:outer membrane protein assembly factor BamD
MRCTRPARRIDYALYLKGVINFNDELGCSPSCRARTCPSATRRRPRSLRVVQRAGHALSRFALHARCPRAHALHVNALAQYEVHVARYYYTRGAYVAAINRAQQALADYRDAPSLEEALYIMVPSPTTGWA